MAVKLIANYAKRLGLPGFSSHQFSVSVETELHDVDQAAKESERLYALLQRSVDEQIQATGFVPPKDYGMASSQSRHLQEKNDQSAHQSSSDGTWHCSEKQRDFLQKLVDEKHLDKNEVEKLAQRMFGVGVKSLSKLQMSGLINELLEQHGGKRNSGGNGTGRQQFRHPYRRAGEVE